jgi:hypothetical protein
MSFNYCSNRYWFFFNNSFNSCFSPKDRKNRRKTRIERVIEEEPVPVGTIVETHISKPARDGLASKVAVCNFPLGNQGEFMPVCALSIEQGGYSIVQDSEACRKKRCPNYKIVPLSQTQRPYDGDENVSCPIKPGTGRLKIISAMKKGCPAKNVLEGLPEDDNGTFIPTCSFSHKGVSLDLDVCLTRKCPYHGRLYLPELLED